MPNLWKMKMKNHNSVFSSFPAIFPSFWTLQKGFFPFKAADVMNLHTQASCLDRRREGFFEIIAGPLCQMETML